MTKAIIFLLNIFRPVFVHLGIDYPQMRTIVVAKLTVNNRIEKTQSKKKNTNNAIIKQGILMSLTGPVIFYLALSQGPLTNALLFFHALLFFMVFINFFTEYSQLLLNTTDNEVLLRLPVNSKTVLSARIVSMLIHILFTTSCLALIPFLIIVFWQGIPVALSFVAGVILNTVFAMMLANLFYAGLLRSIPAGKFEQIVTYVQIVFIAILAISYQFIANLSSRLTIDLSATPPLWMYFTPPCYFMSVTELILHPSWHALALSLTGLACCLFLFAVTITCFGASFSTKISQMATATAGNKPKRNSALTSGLTKLFARNTLQSSGFTLTWRLTSDSLRFKQSVLLIAICIIVPNCVVIYHTFNAMQEHNLSFSILIPLYMLPLLAIIVIPTLGLNDKGNMLWIYQSRPVSRPGQFLLGCFKAVYIKYFVPVFLIFFVLYLFLTGIKITVDLLLVFSFSTLFSLVYYLSNGLLFPFSKEQSMPKSQVFKSILVMVFLVVIAVVHFTLTLLPYATAIAIPLCWGVIILVARRIIRVPWQKIEAQY